MADTADLNVYQGDDYSADVTVLNEDDAPADLTGYMAQSHIRPSLSDASVNPTTSFTTTITGNIITIFLPHTESRKLAKTPYVWDLQVVDGAGRVTTILAGLVKVTKEVTKV